MRPPRLRARLVTTLAVMTAAAATLSAVPAAQAADPAYKVLVFSRTAGFRHDSIPAGVAALKELGGQNGFTVDATEDPAAFSAGNLQQYRAVVWLLTTGDVLDDAQQAAFEQYVRGGGGYAGVHAASDTEYDWPWYGSLVGTYFASHPSNQTATVNVEDRAHASTAHLGRTWSRYDEWYNFRSNPRSDVKVLASLDESSYSGGTMGDHPTAWCHAYDGGRSWYTGGGHTAESYADPDFRAHLLGGIRYAAGTAKADCRPENGYTSLFDGTSTAGWSQAGPGSFTLGADGSLTTSGGLGLLWYSAKQFSAYSLKVDWRYGGGGNSGVFVGFPASDDPWSAVGAGYEVQIDPEDGAGQTTGAVYDARPADSAARDAAINTDGWNTYDITVQGQKLTVLLNGAKINEYVNTDPARDLTQGYVGLQNHGDADTVAFRNVRIKELTPASEGSVLLSQGRSVTASSVESGSYAAANAVDGDAGTRWSSEFSDPQSITVDLASARSVDRVKLSWETAYGKAYEVQTSTDGSSWSPVASTTTGDGGVDDLTFTATTARYVRVYGTQRGTPWGYSLYELQVYGS